MYNHKTKLQTILASLIVGGAIFAGSFSTDARMTDEQVVEYIKTETAAGKSSQQIGNELLAKGVTRAQIERLKNRYEDQQGSEANIGTGTMTATENTLRRNSTEEAPGRLHDAAADLSASSFEDIQRGIEPELEERRTYGRDVFRNNALTFEPNENVATPQNYRLGPGDEVVIDIWGANEDHIRQTISPEGSIIVSQVGPIYLNGMTIKQANDHIRQAFANKYAGIGGTNPDSDINVTLGQVRTIQIDIMGEVAVPGTYRLSPFSTIFHALYKAGGINDIGTMRNIHLVRNGQKMVGVDVYEYLFDGKTTGNTRLQEGDVIIVPPYEELVNISGNVKRPMYYELKNGETLKQVIDFAGGFTGDAYVDQVRVTRQAGRENELYNISASEFADYPLQDGDVVSVGTILDRFTNRVEVKGSVFRPGMFALSPELTTVRDLIAKADGLTEDAYTGRVLLYREGPDLSLEIEALDIDGILSGRLPDIELRRNDVLVISSIHDLEDRGDVTISGLVARPGDYPYADGVTIEDVILQAGGLLKGASTARVEVSRRLVDPDATEATSQMAETFMFSLVDGLIVNADEDFQLQPYDIVEIRRSPGYQVQRRVGVVGEVVFDGTYTLESKSERVSDLVKRAGGLTPEAYVRGASIMRQMTPEERRIREEAIRNANNMANAGDSINSQSLAIPTTYQVAIDLAEALAAPGSAADLVLQTGDVLIVPEMTNTVRITGDVLFPNTVSYKEGKKLKYYIEQAGGYGQRAKKNKAFIVYLNGEVKRAKGSTPIEPGCQIVVPTKEQGQGINWQAIMTVTSMTGTLGTMAAAISNLIRK